MRRVVILEVCNVGHIRIMKAPVLLRNKLRTYCSPSYVLLCINRKGSVIVDFALWVDSTVSSKDLLHDILRNASFSLGGHAVNLDSVRVSGKPKLTLWSINCFISQKSWILIRLISCILKCPFSDVDSVA